MYRGILKGTCPPYILKKTDVLKLFVRVICLTFVASIIWIQLKKEDSSPSYNLVREAIQNVAQDFRYPEMFRKKSRLPKDLKYILLWTRNDFAPFYYLGSGQQKFIHNNCSVINCYVTTDRNFFGGDIKKFDAIAFNGPHLDKYTLMLDLPRSRSPHQKYIFVNVESADNYPLCNSIFEGYFNWTSTYRLDSDIPYPYLLIKNSDGEVVGPKANMKWYDESFNEPEVDEDLFNKLQNKSKAAAWFVSNCNPISERNQFVEKLQKALELYGLKVDIYGKCGTLQCPKNRQSDCTAILESDYYFYLAMENSLCKDYVTEKVLKALQHYAVPIVFGGADYNRFLPPNSYLNALHQSPEKLAEIMNTLINSPKQYSRYFTWKHHYTYHNPEGVENVCNVCAALNNRTMAKKTISFKSFRSWWAPNYRELCVNYSSRSLFLDWFW